MNINGTEVTVRDVKGVTEREILGYIEHIREEYPHDDILTLTISPGEDGKIALDYALRPPRFERIRRITGYLVGDMGRWNNAKRAEESDRVKHGME